MAATTQDITSGLPPDSTSSPTSTGQDADQLAAAGQDANLAGPGEVGQLAAACPNHRIEFHFAIESGQTVHDELGFTMIHPDGTTEQGQLADGGLEREGVPEGLYQLKFKYIENCAWDCAAADGEPEVGMTVYTQGMDDGTAAIFSVHQRFQTSQAPRVQVQVNVSGNQARSTFKYKQALGEVAGGDFIFKVEIAHKQAISDVLAIQRYDLDSVAGVQQRLKELGYDPGPTDGILGPRTEAAVRAFQKDNPELAADGIPGPLTKRELGNA